MTPRQKEIYDFIVQQICDVHRPPTVREIAAEVGIASPNGVIGHLRALEKKGLIRTTPEKARGIAVVAQDKLDLLRKQIVESAIVLVQSPGTEAYDKLEKFVKEYQQI